MDQRASVSVPVLVSQISRYAPEKDAIVRFDSDTAEPIRVDNWMLDALLVFPMGGYDSGRDPLILTHSGRPIFLPFVIVQRDDIADLNGSGR